MFLVSALALLSVAAFAYAGRVALAMVAEAAERRARIARAVRPVEGRALPVRPRTFHDKPGSN